MASSPRRLHVIIELLLAVTSLHLVFLFLFRQYPIPVGWLGREFLPGALLVFTLALVRMWTDQDTDGGLIPFRSRLRPGMALQGIRGPATVLLGCFLAVFFALHEYGGRVGNDGTIIYTYVRSLVVDKDLDLTNEFDEFVPGQSDALRKALRQGGGVPPNELGPALFWLPFFALTHALVKLNTVFGGTISADGYSHPYIQAVCLASLFWAFVGVILSYLMARRYFEPEVASWGAVVLWLASPLLWYTVYEPSMPHAVSLAVVAMFLFSWFRARDTGGTRSLDVGRLHCRGHGVGAAVQCAFPHCAAHDSLGSGPRNPNSARRRQTAPGRLGGGALVAGLRSIYRSPLALSLARHGIDSPKNRPPRESSRVLEEPFYLRVSFLLRPWPFVMDAGGLPVRPRPDGHVLA